MRIGVLGLGAVGARAARQLLATDAVELVVVDDPDREQVARVVSAMGARAEPAPLAHLDRALDAVLLAGPSPHAPLVPAFLRAGAHVVSVSDDRDDVAELLTFDDLARRHGRTLVVGAGFAPGLSCLLALHAATDLDLVDEVHVAKHGTGGPACALQHHRALRGRALDWWDGDWQQRPAGSGRELCWFPDPVGAQDCYRADLPDALLLRRGFPTATRIIGRTSATRRDRLTGRLPMLRKPHPEGLAGAIRVEVRGTIGVERAIRVLGAMDRPAAVAGAVAAMAAVAAVDPTRAPGGMRRTGAGGLAELVADPTALLAELARRGVKAAIFEGAG